MWHIIGRPQHRGFSPQNLNKCVTLEVVTGPTLYLTPSPSRGAPFALSKKQAIFDLLSPLANVAAVTTVFPHTGLPRFLLSPKTHIMS